MSTRTPTTGQLYVEYDNLIARIEKALPSSASFFPGCDPAHVRPRIIQRIVELTSDAYVDRALALASDSRATTARSITVGGLVIDLVDARVSVSAREWSKNALRFFVTWSKAARALVYALFAPAPSRSIRASLLLDAPAIQDDDAQFVAFCRRGRIDPLRAASNLVVAAAFPPTRVADASFRYARQPLMEFVRLLDRGDRVAMLRAHLIAPFRYVRGLFGNPLGVLLGYDAALLPLVMALDRRRLIESLIITTSSFASQPLWMIGSVGRQFSLHMLWYSQNFIPKMYAGDDRRPDLPAARHMRVDEHWVWTEGFKEYLIGLGQRSRVHVVGPILWYLPEPVPLDDSCLRIALFDVTPLPDGHTAFGAAKNYYSVRTISQFVRDVIEVSEEVASALGRRVRLLLKHKRPPKTGRHDSTYIDFLAEMTRINGGFELIDPGTNLFGLLERCNLSVSVPYTSTCYVASFLRKPAIYYDPFSELVPAHEKDPFVHFASGRHELRCLIERLLTAEFVKADSA